MVWLDDRIHFQLDKVAYSRKIIARISLTVGILLGRYCRGLLGELLLKQ